MDFDTFNKKAWADHAEDTQGVADRLDEGLALVTKADHLPALAALIVHVRGEHLGQWDEGLAALQVLTEHESFDEATDPARAVIRSMAVLHHCRGNSAEFEDCLERGRALADRPTQSDPARVHAIIASTLVGQHRIEDAQAAFTKALELAEYGPVQGDPAALALAITGNNLACALEEKTGRSPAEVELMKQAAGTGRRFWEIAGDWKNVERAEYRLAMTHLAADEAETAVSHGEACLAVCEANDADVCERFFANEALALAHHAAGHAVDAKAARNRCAELVDQQEEDMMDFCESTMTKLDARMGAE